jgi:hypothetical protein
MRPLRAELTKQLGGDVTPAQRIIIQEVAKKAAIVQAVGDYVLTRENLVGEDGALLPVVLQHDQLTASLAKLLTMLGLEWRARQPNVSELLAAFRGSSDRNKVYD